MKQKLKLLKSLIEYLINFGWAGFSLFFKIYFGKKIEITIKLPFLRFPFVLRRGTSDIEVFNQIFIENQYKQSKMINDSDIKFIIDCGANIGLSSLYFHYRYPNAKIIAIELEKSNYDLLERNVKQIINIVPVNAGVWHSNTLIKIANKKLDSKFGFIAESVSEVENLVNDSDFIEGLTLETIMNRFHITDIDILKIDIESTEKELFEFADLSFLDRTRILIIEFHDWIKPNCTKVFFEKLKEYHYLCVCRGENLVMEIRGKSSVKDNC